MTRQQIADELVAPFHRCDCNPVEYRDGHSGKVLHRARNQPERCDLFARQVDAVEAAVRTVEADIWRQAQGLVKTHTERDGRYCDTGEDMDWLCRSDCVEMAAARLKAASEAGQ